MGCCGTNRVGGQVGVLKSIRIAGKEIKRKSCEYRSKNVPAIVGLSVRERGHLGVVRYE